MKNIYLEIKEHKKKKIKRKEKLTNLSTQQ